MGRVLLPQQLLRAILPGGAECAVPGAVQLREALPLPILLHKALNLSTTVLLSMRLSFEMQGFLHAHRRPMKWLPPNLPKRWPSAVLRDR